MRKEKKKIKLMKILYLKNVSPTVNKYLPKCFEDYIVRNELRKNSSQNIFYDICYYLCKLSSVMQVELANEIDCCNFYNYILYTNKDFLKNKFTLILIKEKKQILKQYFHFKQKKPKLFHEFFFTNKKTYKHLLYIGFLTPQQYKFLKELDNLFLIWLKLYTLKFIKNQVNKYV